MRHGGRAGGRFGKSGMTRRDFLQRLGIAGGSSMVMSAMSAWDLMGAPAGPRPNWSGDAPDDARVIVLGAGLTGLIVGYELGKLGYDFQVLEARDRVGGVSHAVKRGHTETDLDGQTQVCEFDEGQYLNGGPWRIPHVHTSVMDYCQEMGVPLEVFIDEHEESLLYFEGEEYGEFSGRRLTMRELAADVRGYSSELLAKAADQGDIDLAMDEEDKERLLQYLVREGYLETPDYVYRGGAHRGEDHDPYDFGALLSTGLATRLQSVQGGSMRVPVFQPAGGMDELPKAIARTMPERITFQAEVREIRQTEDEVRVVYRDRETGEEREITGDYVVSCIPLSILRDVEVNLSPEMMEMVQAVGYSGSAKIGVQMNRRFWEEDDGIFGGRVYTNLPLGQYAFPSTGYYGQKGVILGFYGNGATEGLIDRTNEERIEHVVANASKFHPQFREEFDNGYAVFWEKIEFSRGAWASGGGTLRAEQLRKPDGRIFIGCAAASTSAAWMEGAVSAAWNAIDSVHERASVD